VSPSDPLRVVLIGDSMVGLAGPGVVAALEATGEVTASNFGFPGWGTSTITQWRGYVRHAVTATHADLVLLSTGWDGKASRDAAAYQATMRELVSVARSAGASGVVFVQYPKTHPIYDVTPQLLATNAANVAAWNADVAAVPGQLPGEAMYFPVGPSVELDGRYSPWVPPPRDPGAPASTWDRVRRLDGVHLCPPGIELYAAAIAADAEATWRLPPPADGWWVNGWQRNPKIEQGAQFCPADHPPG
jgi:hypothetical protein